MKICERCGVERPKLHRHHLLPKALGGADDGDNLVRLCSNCHEDYHHDPTKPEHYPWRLAHTPDAKAKRSATFRRLWQDPTYRTKMLEARQAKGSYAPEVVARRVAATQRWYAENPEAVKARNAKIAASRSAKGLKPGQRVGESDAEYRARVTLPRDQRRAQRQQASHG